MREHCAHQAAASSSASSQTARTRSQPPFGRRPAPPLAPDRARPGGGPRASRSSMAAYSSPSRYQRPPPERRDWPTSTGEAAFARVGRPCAPGLELHQRQALVGRRQHHDRRAGERVVLHPLLHEPQPVQPGVRRQRRLAAPDQHQVESVRHGPPVARVVLHQVADALREVDAPHAGGVGPRHADGRHAGGVGRRRRVEAPAGDEGAPVAHAEALPGQLALLLGQEDERPRGVEHRREDRQARRRLVVQGGRQQRPLAHEPDAVGGRAVEVGDEGHRVVAGPLGAQVLEQPGGVGPLGVHPAPRERGVVRRGVGPRAEGVEGRPVALARHREADHPHPLDVLLAGG